MKFPALPKRLLSCGALALLAWAGSARPAGAQTPAAESIVARAVEQDRLLQQRRKAFDCTLQVRVEKLDARGKVLSASAETSKVGGDRPPGEKAVPASGEAPTLDGQVQAQRKKEPFEMLSITSHFNFTLDGSDSFLGRDCYKVRYAPKPGLPYHSREEKVANQTGGWLWIDKATFSLLRNEGRLIRPVDVAWFFATLRELEFSFRAGLLPNGDYGPAEISYRFRVATPFSTIHERQTRTFSRYRPSAAR